MFVKGYQFRSEVSVFVCGVGGRGSSGTSKRRKKGWARIWRRPGAAMTIVFWSCHSQFRPGPGVLSTTLSLRFEC